MAEQKNSVVGDVRGKIGDYLYRQVNGKRIVTKASSTYTLSQLPHEIDKRSKQKVNGKFASVINSNPLLHYIWNKKKAPCVNGYNKINKVNYHPCEPYGPSAKAQITPGGFKLEAEEITIKPGSVEITLRPIHLKKNEAIILYILILSLSSPKRRSKNTNDFEFLLLENYREEGPKLIFNLDKEKTALAKKYKNKTIFLAAITMNNEGSIERWSETLGRDYLNLNQYRLGNRVYYFSTRIERIREILNKEEFIR